MNFIPWIPPANGKSFSNAAEKHNAIASEYEEQYNTTYWKLYDVLTWDHMSDFIMTHTVSKERMLDAGGGTGKWARRFIQEGVKHVDLIDLSDNMMEIGKKYAKQENMEDKISFKKADITFNPFEDNSFDIVISQGNPISYCNDPHRAINELSRVAKSGAPVVISVHNKLAMITYFFYFMGKITIEEAIEFSETSKIVIDYPIYAFTPDELIETCEKSGLEVKSIIGKPCISGFVQSEKYIENLSIKEIFDQTVMLEKRYWNNKSIMGMAGHLQVNCIKNKWRPFL